MRFNAKKCNILTIYRAKSPLYKFYGLCGEILKEVPDAKYLVIQIGSKLAFSKVYLWSPQEATPTQPSSGEILKAVHQN